LVDDWRNIPISLIDRVLSGSRKALPMESTTIVIQEQIFALVDARDDPDVARI
jgi:hypothetical protein